MTLKDIDRFIQRQVVPALEENIGMFYDFIL